MDGFRCPVVREAGRIRGFAYGFTGRPGQWWTDHVAARVPEPLAREWVGDHLEVVELAVDPEAQGRGYGAALVDLLLEGAEQDRALLCTWPRGDGRLPATAALRAARVGAAARGASCRTATSGASASTAERTFGGGLPGQDPASYPCPHTHLPNGAPVNTRTIAILALVIAVVLLIIFLV